jgi:hypothetical protein
LTLLLHIQAQETKTKISTFRDSTDHALDMSDFLIHKKGILLIPSLITEPAVGYGLAGAAVFFHSSYSEKNGPPSMSGVLGAGTENGTWAFGVFHIGYWSHDRLRYMGAIVRTDANLGFYGTGQFGLLEDESVNLNLNAWVGIQQLKARLGKSNFFMGGKYILLITDNTFEIPVDNPDYNSKEFNSTLSEVSLLLNYDSRDNIFTPTKGFFITLNGTYSDTWMGGEDLYGRIGLDFLGYFSGGRNLVVGLRTQSNYTLGNVPFYARPFIQLRGAPMMKYQDRNISLMELELSWNFYKRWNLIGFSGMGTAFSSISDFENGRSVRTVGSGFRYLLARKFGAKMGLDFAFSQDDFAFYIVFGSAWLR